VGDVVLRKSEGVEENVRMINTDCVEMYDNIELWWKVTDKVYAVARSQVQNQVLFHTKTHPKVKLKVKDQVYYEVLR
jgi:hypothetical protein